MLDFVVFLNDYRIFLFLAIVNKVNYIEIDYLSNIPPTMLSLCKPYLAMMIFLHFCIFLDSTC
jgi:hypothetical protein